MAPVGVEDVEAATGAGMGVGDAAGCASSAGEGEEGGADEGPAGGGEGDGLGGDGGLSAGDRSTKQGILPFTQGLAPTSHTYGQEKEHGVCASGPHNRRFDLTAALPCAGVPPSACLTPYRLLQQGGHLSADCSGGQVPAPTKSIRCLVSYVCMFLLIFIADGSRGVSAVQARRARPAATAAAAGAPLLGTYSGAAPPASKRHGSHGLQGGKCPRTPPGLGDGPAESVMVQPPA